jgi:hypothetical protein
MQKPPISCVRPSPVTANSPSAHVATSIVGFVTDYLPLPSFTMPISPISDSLRVWFEELFVVAFEVLCVVGYGRASDWRTCPMWNASSPWSNTSYLSLTCKTAGSYDPCPRAQTFRSERCSARWRVTSVRVWLGWSERVAHSAPYDK